ncbi:MAG: TonB C-terminal domain-containing protein [Myxococcales bacterium]|nr:TonB C-terminal domain-containing protein [Myxococcales bacterium]MCB9731489.1 TonB C-terminal domain-containing protein [Deltaproteobacteria bacterium]
MKTPLAIAIGLVFVLLVHGALAAAYLSYREGRISLDEAMEQQRQRELRKRLSICGTDRTYRCGRVEHRFQRKRIEEPPVKEPEILEAAMIPALGGVEPNAKKLPEIEAYQELEKVENGINLDNADPRLEKLIKTEEPKKKLENPLDPRSELAKVLEDYDNDDPRVRRKDIDKITGFKDGEIGGTGLEQRAGSAYSRKAARVMSDQFKVPPFLDDATLKKLQVKVKVTRLGFDGAIQDYQVIKLSGDRTFDDAALATIKRFSTKDGGNKTLPAPEADVLRFINAKGLVITLDGRLMRR